jgi:hypothetical protein
LLLVLRWLLLNLFNNTLQDGQEVNAFIFLVLDLAIIVAKENSMVVDNVSGEAASIRI